MLQPHCNRASVTPTIWPILRPRLAGGDQSTFVLGVPVLGLRAGWARWHWACVALVELAAVALLWRADPRGVYTLAAWTLAECAVARQWPSRARLRNAAMTYGPLLAAVFLAGWTAWVVQWVQIRMGGPLLVWNAGAMVRDHPWALVPLAFLPLLVSDGVYYVYHRLQHAWPILWRFHAVHHCPREFNATIANRQPWTESLTQPLFLGVPLALVNLHVPDVMLVTLWSGIWTHFIHTSIPVRLGWLTPIFGGPQIHRTHHGRDAVYFDNAAKGKNFAAFFPLWDIIGGTFHWPRRDEWPETGVDGADEADPTAAVLGHGK